VGADRIALGVDRLQNFDKTVTKYLPLLYRVALRRLGNHADAEDAVQDALLSAFRHISQFENRSRLSTWLCQIVINSARMQVRRQRNHRLLSLDAMDASDSGHQFIDSGFSPEQACGRAELRRNIHRLMSQLSPGTRKTLQLRHIEGLSTEESAQAQGITQSTVKSRARRGRLQLSRLLAGQGISNVASSQTPTFKSSTQSGAGGYFAGAALDEKRGRSDRDQKDERWIPGTFEQGQESRRSL
jgi:RNA polymerase sigma-70 factor, ECF subfamily